MPPGRWRGQGSPWAIHLQILCSLLLDSGVHAFSSLSLFKIPLFSTIFSSHLSKRCFLFALRQSQFSPVFKRMFPWAHHFYVVGPLWLSFLQVHTSLKICLPHLLHPLLTPPFPHLPPDRSCPLLPWIHPHPQHLHSLVCHSLWPSAYQIQGIHHRVNFSSMWQYAFLIALDSSSRGCIISCPLLGICFFSSNFNFSVLFCLFLFPLPHCRYFQMLSPLPWAFLSIVSLLHVLLTWSSPYLHFYQLQLNQLPSN